MNKTYVISFIALCFLITFPMTVIACDDIEKHENDFTVFLHS